MTSEFENRIENESQTIPYLIHKAHSNAKAKGWWDSQRNPLELLMLAVSELAEAGEEYRNNLPLEMVYSFDTDGTRKPFENGSKPEGFIIELADTIIRLFDLCGAYQLDLMSAIEIKMRYNETREYKHGKFA